MSLQHVFKSNLISSYIFAISDTINEPLKWFKLTYYGDLSELTIKKITYLGDIHFHESYILYLKDMLLVDSDIWKMNTKLATSKLTICSQSEKDLIIEKISKYIQIK